MIIASTIENRPQLSPMVTDTNEFSIKNSSRAFYILSTSLYSDPILAILRELGCNARDSHVQAGQVKPWRLHLPTVINPMLEIEDYGVGLSHDEVMNMFTTFFESTKTNSNEFVGALGLGSKSPFSYTDNFTVIAKKNGERNVYSAYKTDAGVPAIARMHSEPCNQNDSGVLIQIAVKNSDMATFNDRARKAFRFFDQYPTVNQIKLERNTTTLTPKGTSLKIEVLRDSNNAVVVMGGIGYPIQTSRPEFSKYTSILDRGVIFNASIGDVEMTPSREGLTYNKQTSDWIISQCEKLISRIASELQVGFDAQDSDWKKACFIIENSRDKILASACDLISKNYFKNGYPSVQFNFDDLEDMYKIQVRHFILADSYVSKVSQSKQSGALTISPGNMYTHSGESREWVFLWDDQKTRVSDILAFRGKRNTRHFVFQQLPGFKAEDTVETMMMMINKILQPMGHQLNLASSVVKRAPTVKKEKTEYYAFVNKEVGGYYSKKTVLSVDRRTADYDKKTVKYYVTMSNMKIGTPEDNNVTAPNVSVGDVETFIKSHMKSVVGFAKSAKPDTSGLVNVYDHVNSLIQAELKIAETDEGLMKAVLQKWSSSVYSKLPEIVNTDKLDDKLFASMIESQRESVKPFECIGHIQYAHTVRFDQLYKKIANYMQTVYSPINWSALDSDNARVKLANFVYSMRK